MFLMHQSRVARQSAEPPRCTRQLVPKHRDCEPVKLRAVRRPPDGSEEHRLVGLGRQRRDIK